MKYATLYVRYDVGKKYDEGDEFREKSEEKWQ